MGGRVKKAKEEVEKRKDVRRKRPQLKNTCHHNEFYLKTGEQP
jgi:hypothetical protein